MNDVVGNVLGSLGMPPVLFTVVISPVGFEDMIDTALKSIDKSLAVTHEFHSADVEFVLHLGQVFESDAVLFQVLSAF